MVLGVEGISGGCGFLHPSMPTTVIISMPQSKKNGFLKKSRVIKMPVNDSKVIVAYPDDEMLRFQLLECGLAINK